MAIMSKTVLVPWSGGLDSTYLIYKLLGEGYSVEATYIDLTSNGEQSIREKRAIKACVKYFKNYDFKYLGTSFKIACYCGGNQTLAYQFFWPLLLFVTDKHDEMALGYVKNDDAISWLPETKKMYNSYAPFVTNFPKLTFPIIKMGKQELWNGLPDELKGHVTWCESPKKVAEQCGKCNSCKRMKGIAPPVKRNKKNDR